MSFLSDLLACFGGWVLYVVFVGLFRMNDGWVREMVYSGFRCVGLWIVDCGG